MRIRLSDVIVSVLLLALLASASVLLAQQVDERNFRYRCADNLRKLAQAMLIYSNSNRGAYPRTSAEPFRGPDNFDPKDKGPAPTWGTPYEADANLNAVAGADPFAGGARPDAHDVTAALFLLLRNVEITSDAFVCPSTGRRGWDYGGAGNTAKHWTNWKGKAGLRDHLDYSYQNPYPSRMAVATGFKLNNTISADFAVAADLNPGVEELPKLTPASRMSELRAVNSLNHGRDGQNVAFGDSHVEWLKTPLVGTDGDNIYTFGRDGRRPAGKERKWEHEPANGTVGAPVDEKDSILLPTARDLGLLDDKAGLDATAKRRLDIPEYDAVADKLTGRYSRTGNGMTVHMEITPTQIGWTTGNVSASARYEIRKVEKDVVHARFGVDLPDKKLAAIRILADGVEITGARDFDGKWTSKP